MFASSLSGEEYILLALLMAGGGAIASFIGAWSTRWGRGESALLGRSRCDTCRHNLSSLDLVPVFSWIIRRGRCRYCGAAIAPFYPILEATGALGVAWVWLTPLPPPPIPPLLPLLLLTYTIGFTLLSVAATDIRHMLIADRTLILLATIAVIFHGNQNSLDTAVWGAICGGGIFLAIRWLYSQIRGREGLGLGDVKLMAAAGALLGWQALPAVVAIAGLLALASVTLFAVYTRVMGGESQISGVAAVPFGAFLSVAIWLAWLYPALYRL